MYADLIINTQLNLASLPISVEFGLGSTCEATASATWWGFCTGLSSDINIAYIGLLLEKMKLTTRLDFGKVGFDWSETKLSLVGKAP